MVLKLDWPSDLADKDLCAVALFECHGPRYQPPRRWGLWSSKRTRWQQKQVVIDSRSNQCTIDVPWSEISRIRLLFGGFRPSWRRTQHIGMMPYGMMSPGSGAGTGMLRRPGCSCFVNLPPKSRFRGPRDRHRLRDRGVFPRATADSSSPHADPKTASGWHSFLVLSLVQPELNSTSFSIVCGRPMGYCSRFATANASSLAISEPTGAMLWGRFSARPGQVNEWMIPLPDELVKSVRAKLKAETPPAERPGLPVDCAVVLTSPADERTGSRPGRDRARSTPAP